MGKQEIVGDEIAATVEQHRAQFRQLLAINPNYFGTLAASDFSAVIAKQGDTTYESLHCVSYSPERDRLEATISVRKGLGFSGGLCGSGSHEHVRFYVSYNDGTTWQDAGVGSSDVHDLPAARDCHDVSVFPLSYVLGVGFSPKRSRCAKPTLPLVRAILSWELVPPANEPDWAPVWGSVRQCHFYVRPRGFVFSDIASKLSKEVLAEIPNYVLEQPPIPIPDPGPVETLTLTQTHSLYEKSEVPLHRYALPHVMSSVTSSPVLANEISKLGIDLSSLIDLIVSPGAGDTSYEQLYCVGLDNNANELVAAFQVKKTSGYSGGPCTAGSTEYVAFWSDFGDKCTYEYLGTVPVTAHDFHPLPDGGLCVAAVLPVDVSKFRRDCEHPVFGRVRAVLSWGTPPSTTDPDAVPHWGNRVDAHVQLRPGTVHNQPILTHVGGVNVTNTSNVTGLTTGSATIAANSFLVGPDCPFAGFVEVRGAPAPAGGQVYRLMARNVTQNGSPSPLVGSFAVDPFLAPSVTVTPGPDGWTPWLPWSQNTDGVLGGFAPGGDDLWEITVELQGAGQIDSHRFRADNTLMSTVDLTHPDNAGSLTVFTSGQCRWDLTQPLNGRFTARDLHFASWSISVLGGPTGNPTGWTLSTPGNLPSTSQTVISGQQFSLNLAALDPCGYVVRLTIADKAIVDSAAQNHATSLDRGICLE